MWPSGMAAGGSGQIPVAPAVVSAGKVGRRARGSPSVDSLPELGSGLPWRWRAAVASGAGRGFLMPGEARRPAGQHTSL
jgi:hypothetical protein